MTGAPTVGPLQAQTAAVTNLITCRVPPERFVESVQAGSDDIEVVVKLS